MEGRGKLERGKTLSIGLLRKLPVLLSNMLDAPLFPFTCLHKAFLIVVIFLHLHFPKLFLLLLTRIHLHEALVITWLFLRLGFPFLALTFLASACLLWSGLAGLSFEDLS